MISIKNKKIRKILPAIIAVCFVGLLLLFIGINTSTANADILTSKQFNAPCNDPNGTITASNCGIVAYLQLFINVLSGLVGIVIVIMIIWGGIEYSSAGNDPQKVGAAKSKISNALLALVVFIFMYSFLQWVVPGGIFH